MVHGMGRSPDPAPGVFAARVALFVRVLVAREGGDTSGRWLAARLPRGTTYYRQRLVGLKVFDANDVEDLAGYFGMSPHAFLRDAVMYAELVERAERSERAGSAGGVGGAA